jgi:hypothetical protein
MVGAGGAPEREAARREAKGQRPLYRRRVCLLVTDGPTAVPRGASDQTNGGRTNGP